MNNSVLKNIILLLSIVFFIFSLSACETIKAAITFKWGKRTEYERHLEAKTPKKEYPSIYTKAHGNEQTKNVATSHLNNTSNAQLQRCEPVQELRPNFSFNFWLTIGGTMVSISPPNCAASLIIDELVKIHRRPVIRKTV